VEKILKYLKFKGYVNKLFLNKLLFNKERY